MLFRITEPARWKGYKMNKIVWSLRIFGLVLQIVALVHFGDSTESLSIISCLASLGAFIAYLNTPTKEFILSGTTDVVKRKDTPVISYLIFVFAFLTSVPSLQIIFESRDLVRLGFAVLGQLVLIISAILADNSL